MRRTLVVIVALVLSFFSVTIAQATTPILLTEPTHRQISGEFIDDELTTSLAPTGRLGELVFNPPIGKSKWVIDPALIEEVTSMSQGYKLTSGSAGNGELVAKSWLSQLGIITKSNTVIAMAYGNPSSFWIGKLSPHETNYVLTISQTLLAQFLGRPVDASPSYHSSSHFSISSADVATIKSDTNDFEHTAPYVDPTTIDIFRLALVKILNPSLTQARREYLIRDFTAAAYSQIHLIHLSPGKFTVTSAHENLPITLSNGFPTDVTINLYVFPTNFKVRVGNLQPVVIPAKSKVQVMVPITVLTSGSSGLSVEMTTSRGNLVGDPIIYPLKLSVISPIATWFTTGAAIVLFLVATIQSARRIRRRKK
jgi:hypothetical protein